MHKLTEETTLEIDAYEDCISATFSDRLFAFENSKNEIHVKNINTDGLVFPVVTFPELRDRELDQPSLVLSENKRFLLRQFNPQEYELFDIVNQEKLESFECDNVPVILSHLCLMLTTKQTEGDYLLKISHLPTQRVLKFYRFDKPIKEVVFRKGFSKAYLLLKDESTSTLMSLDLVNRVLYNQLQKATKDQRKLYYKALLYESSDQIQAEIPNYKELLEKCPRKMKQVIEEALGDSSDENAHEELFFQPSFWQRHKRKIMGGLGIVASASILYGLYSWYYSSR